MFPLTLSSPSVLPSPKTLIAKTLISKPLILNPRTLIPKTLNSKTYPLHCSSPSISTIKVADLVEKDYSFLDFPSTSSQQSQIIAAAKITEESKILISFPTLGFLDLLVNSAKCELIVAVHESLFLLAMIKEGNDGVRCFQGGIGDVPEKFVPFDVVFVCYFPGMGVGIGELLASTARLCSKGFVDRFLNSAKCELLIVVHESMFLLVMIKEENDGVRCFQSGIDGLPEKFAPYDVVFVCYFPGMRVGIGELLASTERLCSKGGRLVISFDQGRETIEREHKKLFPDMPTTDLLDKITLEKVATDHSFQITEFVDEPALYLAVLKLC